MGGAVCDLATLRHPLLHALIDYGAAGPRSLFEAFEPAEPVTHRGRAAALAAHARRFVEAHGVPFTSALTHPPRRRTPPASMTRMRQRAAVADRTTP